MTACNVFVSPAEAVVYTDGAWLRPDGTVGCFGPKVLALPHLPAIVATQGQSFLLPLLRPTLERFGSFDEMVGELPGFMRDPPEALRPYLCDPSHSLQRLFLVGYSAVLGAMAGVYMQGVATPDLPAWDTCAFTCTVSPTMPEIRDELGPEPGIPTPHLAADIMSAQRGFAGDIGSGMEALAVGGFCLGARCTPDGISMRVVRRWPDRIGERINPSFDVDVGTSTPFRRDPPALKPMACAMPSMGRIGAGPIDVRDQVLPGDFGRGGSGKRVGQLQGEAQHEHQGARGLRMAAHPARLIHQA